jgi:hypothetical protein
MNVETEAAENPRRAVNTELLALVVTTFQGSDGDATKALYDRLSKCGPLGQIALNLFRAHKNSARAKVYRGGIRGQGSFKGMAYDRKEWSIRNLCDVLDRNRVGIRWGWAIDEEQEFHKHVLYVDIPTGQVSFHAAARGKGPDYYGKWDGVREAGAGRICEWCARLLERLA